MIPAGVLMLLALIVSTLSWAEPPAVTATLSRVEPSDAIARKWVQVKRGSDNLTVNTGMTIQAGDTISMQGKQTSVLLTLPYGQEKRVSQGESPYTFDTHAPGVTDRFFKVAGVLGGEWLKPEKDGTVTSASTGRGGKGPSASANCGCGDNKCLPRIPADMVDPTVKLVAGMRELSFHWVGGGAPYQLRLLMNGEVIQEVNKIEACQITLPSRHWQPGVYTLELRDTGSPKVFRDRSLTFVEASAVPQAPAVLQSTELSQDERTLLEADWLAKQENCAWRLEAVQRVAPLIGWHPLAEDWMQRWAYGEHKCTS